MAKGGYLGGGTIVSIWSLAKDAARRRFEETTADTSGNRKRRRKAKPQPQPVTEISPEVQARRDAVRAKPAVKMPNAMIERGAFLKAQVVAGVLLRDGKPNPKHPANRKDHKK
jgi:hypothetical protein